MFFEICQILTTISTADLHAQDLIRQRHMHWLHQHIQGGEENAVICFLANTETVIS